MQPVQIIMGAIAAFEQARLLFQKQENQEAAQEIRGVLRELQGSE